MREKFGTQFQLYPVRLQKKKKNPLSRFFALGSKKAGIPLTLSKSMNNPYLDVR